LPDEVVLFLPIRDSVLCKYYTFLPNDTSFFCLLTQAFLLNEITVLPDDVVLFLPIQILFLCIFYPSFFFLDDGSVKIGKK